MLHQQFEQDTQYREKVIEVALTPVLHKGHYVTNFAESTWFRKPGNWQNVQKPDFDYFAFLSQVSDHLGSNSKIAFQPRFFRKLQKLPPISHKIFAEEKRCQSEISPLFSISKDWSQCIQFRIDD